MRLLQHNTRFFDLFDEHVTSLSAMGDEFNELFRSFDRLAERQARIKELEHACDRCTHDLVTAMHGTFVTPLDKEDIAALASGLDTVADWADSAASRVLIYRIPEATPASRQLAALLREAIGHLAASVRLLRNPKQRARIVDASREIHRIENESDAIYQAALGDLFNTAGVDPIFVMKWREVYDHMERAVDQCEDVANVLEGIHIKYA